MVMRGVPSFAGCPLRVMRSRSRESELLAESSTWLSSLQETGGGKESAPQAAPTSGGESLGGLCMRTGRAQRGSLRLHFNGAGCSQTDRGWFPGCNSEQGALFSMFHFITFKMGLMRE